MSSEKQQEPGPAVASQDRHVICEIGRLFWGDNKQCYSADAVLRKVQEALSRHPEQKEDTRGICPKCNLPFTNLPEHLTLHREDSVGKEPPAAPEASAKAEDSGIKEPSTFPNVFTTEHLLDVLQRALQHVSTTNEAEGVLEGFGDDRTERPSDKLMMDLSTLVLGIGLAKNSATKCPNCLQSVPVFYRVQVVATIFAHLDKSGIYHCAPSVPSALTNTANDSSSQNSGVPPSPASQEWLARGLMVQDSDQSFFTVCGNAEQAGYIADAHNAALRAAVEASKDKDLGEQ